jgi:hypothetical protein
MKCDVCGKEVVDVIHIRVITETVVLCNDEWYVMCKNCYNEYKARR